MAGASQTQAERLDIRKYSNRRYYDATHSRPVTLEEIYQFIRDGKEVRVTDAKTKEDITVRVLAQIILDMDDVKLSVFPVQLLHRLIQSNEALMHDFVEKYFNQALNLFLTSRRQFEDQLRAATGLGVTPLDWTRMMSGAFVSPFAPKPAEPAQPAGEDRTTELEKTLRDLQERVQELQRSSPNHGSRKNGQRTAKKKTKAKK